MLLRKIVFYTQMSGPGAFQFESRHLERLRQAAPDTELRLVGLDNNLLLREAEGADAAVVQNNHPLPSEFFSAAKSLRWVHCLMSGTDRVHVPEQVTLTATMGTHGVPISEHVLAMMLSASRGLYLSRDNQQIKLWERPYGITELRGATAGVVGLGNIGTKIAELLGVIGMKVVATSGSEPSVENRGLLSDYYSGERFDEFVAACDYIILSVPLTAATWHMFGKKQFSQMKRSAWIINVARGPVIDEAALLEALQSKEIAGACLDVAEEEPRPEGDPLWTLPNVIITPHVANATPKKMDRVTELLSEQLSRCLRDEPLLYQARR